MGSPGRRITYDRFWGALLLLSCILPYYVAGAGSQGTRPLFVWDALANDDGERAGDPEAASAPARPALDLDARIWLIAGSGAGLLVFTGGLVGARGRGRHLLNFVIGASLLGYAAWRPGVFRAFPECNPALHPLPKFGQLGWVPLVSMLALYAGSGMRIARPTQPTGQAVAGLAAFLLLVFFFIPLKGQPRAFGLERLSKIGEFTENARDLAPFLLVLGAAGFGVLNLIRTGVEVPLARGIRFLLIAAFLLPWFPDLAGGTRILPLLPVLWGAIRIAAPVFLALDACCAHVAITLTRSEE